MKRYLALSAVLLVFMLFLPLLAGHPASDSGVSRAEELPERDILLVLDRSSGQVLSLTMEEYLCGAVASEMPASFDEDALAAQACACHTLAYRCRAQQQSHPDPELKGAYFSVDCAAHEGYFPRADAKAQWGGKFEEAWGKIERAVAEAGSNLIVSDGEPILAVYHAISPGLTESSEVYWGNAVSYLTPVNSEWDRLSDGYESAVTLSAEEFRSVLAAAEPSITLPGGCEGWMTEIKTSPSGTVTSVSVGGVPLSGRRVREIFSLRSACFTVSAENGEITFTVRGYGHGVGMSQVGADYLARQGSGWRDILAYYYPGAEIRSAL